MLCQRIEVMDWPWTGHAQVMLLDWCQETWELLEWQWIMFLQWFSNMVWCGTTSVIIFSCDKAALRKPLSVRRSTCLSVTLFLLCSCHLIIIKFSGVITIENSNVHASGQGQRSKVKVTDIKTQFNLLGTLTPFWINTWLWNDAQSKQFYYDNLYFLITVYPACLSYVTSCSSYPVCKSLIGKKTSYGMVSC